ncbi:hypothetical protein [Coraliomargarita akajimensis]|uniref:Uncharacterized protein n=1 Tax=Coraliomargarita akajimensis (strain DSM 45221 / IAM 15411 / JCM 23193 / KCTC 12865 / 04OKA010-24) TaxID=583355 RepID=D5EPW3_CORAD|nr:hypothetical protein [Coraliomargarita akajimensis]ADE55696.1 hypothetical protein Caka_2681 [Coraliomargarita akajimensis DSM 45221]
MSQANDKVTLADRAYSILGAITPSCSDALRMVELGQQRPLKLHERFILFYNSPLCLHCNCKRETFEAGRQQLRAVELERKGR